MPALLIKLRPTGPWRIGPDSGDRDRVDRVYHSDSLYSAVCGAMSQLGDLDGWLEATARAAEPAVRFSSCFPFYGETLYVVPPRNVWPPPASAKTRFKGARFVPLRVVETLISGRAMTEDNWAIDVPSECLIAGGAQGPFRVNVRSNAAVDRGGDGVAPHSSACLEFTPGAGLWFIASFADDAARERWKPPLEGALRLLADSGFGGGRSKGWGRSQIPEVTDGELPQLLLNPGEEAGAYWLLSVFHPAATDSIDWQHGNYSLTTRGGRIESTGGAKMPTRMLTEGSVVVSASAPVGATSDVAPENFAHPVYRSGFALAIPVPLAPLARPA
ncbi:MAG TPA: type III-A CRISPR-associated RAMP protein Csm4 [Bryobacteraceae bacterium]|nr:type III-A CRISPR-associated RAMP protein Csm4 [Bryobacteraceae bacterium]